MSYVRFSPESDVYVFETTRNGVPFIECCACSLEKVTGIPFFLVSTTVEMADHLRCHLEAGDLVPDWALQNVIDGTERAYIAEHADLIEPSVQL